MFINLLIFCSWWQRAVNEVAAEFAPTEFSLDPAIPQEAISRVLIEAHEKTQLAEQNDIMDSTAAENAKPTLRGRSKENVLSESLEKLLGQAHFFYASGNDEDASKLYRKVIQQHPAASQAWLSLALIEESKGNQEKALLMKFCAAENAKEEELWLELGEEVL